MIWKLRIKAARLIFMLAMLVAPSRGAGGVFISDDGQNQNARRQFKRLNRSAIDWAFEWVWTSPDAPADRGKQS